MFENQQFFSYEFQALQNSCISLLWCFSSHSIVDVFDQLQIFHWFDFAVINIWRWRFQFYGPSFSNCWNKNIWLSTLHRQENYRKGKKESVKIWKKGNELCNWIFLLQYQSSCTFFREFISEILLPQFAMRGGAILYHLWKQ